MFGYLMGGCRDAGFGVYAKCGILRKLLKRRWAGKRHRDSVALCLFLHCTVTLVTWMQLEVLSSKMPFGLLSNCML